VTDQILAEGPNAGQINYWNTQAGQTWVQMQPQLDREIEALGLAAMDALAPSDGERVIDIGCGAGASSLELAQRVGPNGHILGVDISQPMMSLARQRADDAGLGERISFQLADAQTYPFPPGEAEAAFSRFGVMFFADPAEAFGNIRKALRANGRLGFLCWRPVALNPFMSLPFQAAVKAAPDLAAPAGADPFAPGPFAFADDVRVRSILETAGFRDIEIRPHDAFIDTGALDEAVNFALRIGMLGTRLRENPHLVSVAAAAVRDELAQHITDGEVKLQSATWIVTARN
jgi:ubiquinone/menaquinone biosynthesis C-methylase UbiE